MVTNEQYGHLGYRWQVLCRSGRAEIVIAFRIETERMRYRGLPLPASSRLLHRLFDRLILLHASQPVERGSHDLVRKEGDRRRGRHLGVGGVVVEPAVGRDVLDRAGPAHGLHRH